MWISAGALAVLQMMNVAGVGYSGESGPVLTPGDLDASLLWEMLAAARLYAGTTFSATDESVNAFNADLPYDEFVVQQLAGDELPEATRESVTATG